MKTNSDARSWVWTRFVLSCVFLLGIVGLEVHLGFQMVAGVCQTTITRIDSDLGSKTSLESLMVSVR